MNDLLYKRKLVELKFKEKENYSLKREENSFQQYYKVKVNVKYGQSKILLDSSDIKNIKLGSYIECSGVTDEVYVKSLENNYIYLSRPILSFGKIEIIFKCKLNLKDTWLDWSQSTWKQKISDSKSKFSSTRYSNQDSYFLKVKNYYESTCLFPTNSYFVRENEIIEVLENLYCGGSYINTNNIEDVTCGESARFAGMLNCNASSNNISVDSELFCEDIQTLAGNKNCNDSV